MIFYLKGGIAIEIHHTAPFITAMEIFYARLPHLHPQKQYIESQLTNIKIGDRGESKALRALEEVQFDAPVLLIRNFVARVHKTRIIQIDYLLITPKYLLIVEVKNISGHVKFNPIPPQIIRSFPEKTPQAFDCPFTQLDRNLDGFQTLFPNLRLPIYTSLVWANSSTTFDLSFNPPHPFHSIKKFPLFIQQLEKLPKIISFTEFKLLKSTILRKTKVFQEQSLCKRYQVEQQDLLAGLYCPTCHANLKKYVRTWVCKGCNKKVHNLIDVNIVSQFYIHGPELSIATIQKHLPMIGRKKIRDVLVASGYIAVGQTNSRLYNRKVEDELSEEVSIT